MAAASWMAAAVAFHRLVWYWSLCGVDVKAEGVWRRDEGRAAAEANVRWEEEFMTLRKAGCWRRAFRARAVARIVKRV